MCLKIGEPQISQQQQQQLLHTKNILPSFQKAVVKKTTPFLPHMRKVFPDFRYCSLSLSLFSGFHVYTHTHMIVSHAGTFHIAWQKKKNFTVKNIEPFWFFGFDIIIHKEKWLTLQQISTSKMLSICFFRHEKYEVHSNHLNVHVKYFCVHVLRRWFGFKNEFHSLSAKYTRAHTHTHTHKRSLSLDGKTFSHTRVLFFHINLNG